MLWILGSLALLGTCAIEVAIWWANSLSDAPGVQMSYWPTAVIGLGVAGVLFAGAWRL